MNNSYNTKKNRLQTMAGIVSLFLFTVLVPPVNATDQTIGVAYNDPSNTLAEIKTESIADNLNFLEDEISEETSDQKTKAGKNSEASNLIAGWIKEITPYISVNDQKMLIFDENDAIAGNLSEKSFRLAKVFVAVNNKEMSQIQDGEQIQLSDQDKAFYELVKPFFANVAKNNVTIGVSKTSRRSGKLKSLAMLACGGGYSKPHRCPKTEIDGRKFSSYNDTRNWLLSHGFHLTDRRARYSSAEDFTKCENAYGCDGCIFRMQAWIFKNGKSWNYKKQREEPNPEVWTYRWPAWWWGTYTFQWHHDIC
jgi:hypothetical protein